MSLSHVYSADEIWVRNRRAGQRFLMLQETASAVAAGKKVFVACPTREQVESYHADLKAILGPEAGWAGSVEFLPPPGVRGTV